MSDMRLADRLNCDEARDLAAGFVLGALELAAMNAVREHLGSCPEPHPEFAELGGVVPYLAESPEPVEPSTALRDRVLAAVAAEVTVAPMTPAPPPSLAAERARRRSPLTWAAAIAAVVVIAALGAWNLQLRSELDTSRAYQEAVSSVFAIASAPGGQAAILSPSAPGGPSGLGAIGPDGSIAIAMHDLDPTSGSEVYEAWVIGSDHKPVPVGSFVVDASGLGRLVGASGPSAPGVVLALTHEPTAGRTEPTLPVISSGVASGPAQG